MANGYDFPSGGIGFNWIIDFVSRVVAEVIVLMTPKVKMDFEEYLLSLYGRARETANPWDDFLVRFLMRILGMDVP
jgi:hypothetical protein